MKKLTMAFLFVFGSLLVFTSFNGCGEEEIVTNNPVTTTKGVFVLYEGTFGQPASYDYAFIDTGLDTVFSNVYQNSNGGSALNSFPNGMQLMDNDLYISAQGTFNQPGSLYKINSTTNQPIHIQPSIGKNPYNFVFANGNIYVTNSASDYVKVVDMNFNTVVDSISVGFNPADILYSGGNIFVGKQTYTFENSLAVINSSHQVNKIFFPGAPVSIALNSGKVYISTFGYRKLFVVDASTAQVTDSISMPVTQAGIGYLASGSANTMYVLGTDTAFQYMQGVSIYKVDLLSKTIDAGFTVNVTGTDVIYGIDYDAVENKIYTAIAKGNANGEVRVYSTSGTLLKTYGDIGGKYPRRFAFKY
jgi:YVTN family beta-propeller protein